MRNMLRFVLLFSLIICPLVICKRRQKEKESSESDLGGKLVSDLRNDANIDLSADEEYEDLRAELLAYHTALASLTSGRRSMKSTPCWERGGVCVDSKMCEGHRLMTEVNGCRDRLEVCCFSWNKFQARDLRDQGIPLPMPWSQRQDYGGKGVVDPPEKPEKKKKKKKLRKLVYDIENRDVNPPVVVILRRKKNE